MIINKNEKFAIAINRELGSGGHTVGAKLAEKLGVKFYDKDVLKVLEDKFHLSIEEIERLKGQRHGWWADVCRMMLVGQDPGADLDMPKSYDGPGLLTADDVFKAETELLQNVAAEDSCVVSGRSGFYALRNHPNHLSILIQASMDSRIERVARKQNMTTDEARKTIEQVDRMRENYVKKYTGTSRYDTRNYQLVITADGKTEEEIADIIMRYIGG
jgi:cytidylate kinase